MKVIFLDFDGVLNSDPYLASYYAAVARNGARAEDHEMLDPENLRLLDELATRTGAQFVVSSSWRHEFNVPALALILERRGLLTASRVIAVTPDLHRPRFEEIQAWLDAHLEVESFVILDDELDMGHLAKRHICTSPTTGLRRKDIKRAAALLSAPC